MPTKFPGKARLSDRPGAPWVGHWFWTAASERAIAFKDLRKNYDAAIAAAEAFQAHAQALKAEGTLTEKGIKERLVERAVKDISELRTMQNKATAGLRRDVEARIKRMSPVNFDRKDVFGEMQRREIRDRLAAMKPEDRRAAVMKSTDPMVIDAILGAPELLVDLPKSTRDQITRARMEERHGSELLVLETLIEAADATDRAFEAAREELQHTAGMSPREYSELRKSVEEPIQEEWNAGFGKTAPNPEGHLGKLELAASDAELAKVIALADFRNADGFKRATEEAPDTPDDETHQEDAASAA